MTYLLAILIVVVGFGAAVIFRRRWKRTRDNHGLGQRLSDNWDGWKDGR